MFKSSKIPSNREIYIWNFVGSIMSAMLSILVMMIVTRTLVASQADIFTLGWSTSQLMATVGAFQVRLFQSTDVNNQYNFGQYLSFRILTLIIMIIFTILYCLYYGFSSAQFLIIFLLTLYRIADCLADLYEGEFQVQNRLDLAGKAQVARFALTIIMTAIVGIFSSNVISLCLAMLFANFLVFILFDYMVLKISFVDCINQKIVKLEWQWVSSLFKDVLPLFINAYLAMSILNEPKLAIERALKARMFDSGAQASFTVLFMPSSFMTLIYTAFRPLITKMAVYWNGKEFRYFIRTLMVIVVALAIFSVPTLVAGYFLGLPVLSLLYHIDLTGKLWAFIFLLLGGVFYMFANVFDNVLVVMRKQKYILIAYILTFSFVLFSSDKLIAVFGFDGTGILYLLSMIFYCAIMFILFITFYFSIRKRYHYE